MSANQCCCCCFIVPQSSVAVVTNCGKYEGLAAPGLHCVDPCHIGLAGSVSLRVQHRHLRVASKTKENVFVTLSIEVQYQVLPGAIDVAFFYLEEPQKCIDKFVSAYIRSAVPLYKLDDLYIERRHIATEVKTNVDHKMDEFGYDILTVLITDIDPDAGVRTIMDSVLAAKRLQVAATDAAEAESILKIKRAEASAELARLSAVGVAAQRREVLKGLEFSVEAMREALPEYSTDELLHVLLTNQYLDTLKEVAGQGASQGTRVRSNTSGGAKANVIASAFQQAISGGAGINNGTSVGISGNEQMLQAARDRHADLHSKYTYMYAHERGKEESVVKMFEMYREMNTLSEQVKKLEKLVADEAKAAKSFQLSNAHDLNAGSPTTAKNEDEAKMFRAAIAVQRARQAARDTDTLYMPHVSGLKAVAKQVIKAAHDAVPKDAKDRAAMALLAGKRAAMQ